MGKRHRRVAECFPDLLSEPWLPTAKPRANWNPSRGLPTENLRTFSWIRIAPDLSALLPLLGPCKGPLSHPSSLLPLLPLRPRCKTFKGGITDHTLMLRLDFQNPSVKCGLGRLPFSHGTLGKSKNAVKMGLGTLVRLETGLPASRGEKIPDDRGSTPLRSVRSLTVHP
jgi:hypothetical protein